MFNFSQRLNFGHKRVAKLAQMQERRFLFSEIEVAEDDDYGGKSDALSVVRFQRGSSCKGLVAVFPLVDVKIQIAYILVLLRL